MEVIVLEVNSMADWLLTLLVIWVLLDKLNKIAVVDFAQGLIHVEFSQTEKVVTRPKPRKQVTK